MLDEVLVFLFHAVQAFLDAQRQGDLRFVSARRAGCIRQQPGARRITRHASRAGGIRPFFNFFHRRIVVGLHFAKFLFDGIVGVGIWMEMPVFSCTRLLTAVGVLVETKAANNPANKSLTTPPN